MEDAFQPQNLNHTHLRKLVWEGEINKEYNRQGLESVFYSLTTRSRQKRLLLQRSNEEKEQIRQKAYQLLFSFAAGISASKVEGELYSEEQLDLFLSEVNSSRKDLIIDEVIKSADPEVTIFKSLYGIRITKSVYPENYGGINRPAFTVICYQLPGVSISDLINRQNDGVVFQDLNTGTTRDELKQCFRLLSKEHIIRPLERPLGRFRGEARYEIAEKFFSSFITDCWLMWSATITRLDHTWRYIRGPSKQYGDESWFANLYGKKKSQEYFATLYEERRKFKSKYNERIQEEFKKVIRHSDNNIRQWWKILHERHRSIILNPDYITATLLEITYPKFLRDMNDKNKNTKSVDRYIY